MSLNELSGPLSNLTIAHEFEGEGPLPPVPGSVSPTVIPSCGVLLGYGSSRATRRGMGLPRWRRDQFPKRHSTPAAAQPYSTESTISEPPHPIYYLPVEILQRIFTCFAEPRPSDTDNDPFLQVYPEWITITYVCRHWRDVALNHHSLWSSITPNLSLTWMKALMDRSGTAPVDAELRVRQTTVKRLCLSVDDAIELLSGCTRLRSLRLQGSSGDVCALLDALRIATPINSLVISLWGHGPPVGLPEDLFGGQAPVRRIDFAADRCIIAPNWLLRGVTHFTSREQIALLDLLEALRQMPALTHFTLQHCRAQWQDSEASGDPPVEMPHLEELVVHADSPRYFALLNQRIATPQSAKRRLELRTLALTGWDRWLRWFTIMLPIIQAENGLQHLYLRGGAKGGTFRTWTGDAETPFEDAKFGFEMYWYGSPTTTIGTHLSSPIFHLGSLCNLLGATDHGRFLVLEGDPARADLDLPASCWWRLLEKLPTIEKLDLHPNAVAALYSGWDDVGAPAILPALQTVKLISIDAPASSVVAVPSVEPRTHVATVRRGFISRIVPSRAAKADSRPRTVAWVPSTARTDDAIPSVVRFTGIHSENILERLITLMHRR